MADSDPRKIRPLAQSSDRRSFDAEEDPLMELARIVSEDSGFYGTKPPKSNTARVEPIDRNAPSVDLEAELLAVEMDAGPVADHHGGLPAGDDVDHCRLLDPVDARFRRTALQDTHDGRSGNNSSH